LIQTVAIPRGQTVLAFGTASKDATSFELTATRDVTTNGSCSNPFLEFAFETTDFRINVTIHADDSWEYQEDTVMVVRSQPQPFHHSDRSVLTRIAQPTPNPLARR
jgi:hypothetical protein